METCLFEDLDGAKSAVRITVDSSVRSHAICLGNKERAQLRKRANVPKCRKNPAGVLVGLPGTGRANLLLRDCLDHSNFRMPVLRCAPMLRKSHPSRLPLLPTPFRRSDGFCFSACHSARFSILRYGRRIEHQFPSMAASKGSRADLRPAFGTNTLGPGSLHSPVVVFAVVRLRLMDVAASSSR